MSLETISSNGQYWQKPYLTQKAAQASLLHKRLRPSASQAHVPTFPDHRKTLGPRLVTAQYVRSVVKSELSLAKRIPPANIA